MFFSISFSTVMDLNHKQKSHLIATNKKVFCNFWLVNTFVFIIFEFVLVLQDEIGRLHSKCAQLEAALNAREQELAQAETRYRKYAEKATEVIKTLEPRIMSGKNSSLK